MLSCVHLFCDPMDYSNPPPPQPGSSVHGIFQTRITGVGCLTLLQGIFSTQGLNLGLTLAPALTSIFFTTGLPGKPMSVGVTILLRENPTTELDVEGVYIKTPLHTVHGVLEAWMLEWFALLFSSSEGRGSLVCCSPWGRRVGHGWATRQQGKTPKCRFGARVFIFYCGLNLTS